MGSLWSSFSTKQAAQLFSRALCSPLKTRLNICFHLSEMEEGWYERRKVYAGLLIPTDALLLTPWEASTVDGQD